MKGDDFKTLIGCFFLSFLLAGYPRVSSIFFVESMNRYNVNRKHASFPYVLGFAVRQISGPLVGYLEQIFGLKFVTISGTIMTTISIGAYFFAEDILTITVLWGVVAGTGIGLGTNLIPSLLNQQFPNHKSKANSFSFSGTCLGSFLLSPLIENSMNFYGISGSFLVLSAILAHSIPAGLLLTTIISDAVQNNKRTSYKNNVKCTIQNTQPHSNAPNSYSENVDFQILNNAIHSEKIQQDKVTSKTGYDFEVNNQSDRTEQKASISGVKNNGVSKKSSLSSFRVLIDPAYVVLMMIHSAWLIIFAVFWTIIIDFLRDKGIDQNLEVYFLMLFQVSDLFGRATSGYFLDKNFLTMQMMSLIVDVLISLFLTALVFSYHYLLLMLFGALIFIFQGVMTISLVALVHEYIEEEKRSMAMASRFILYPPLSFGISPVIGYFRESQGSYDSFFFILSGISLFCGFSTCLLPRLVKRKQNLATNGL